MIYDLRFTIGDGSQACLAGEGGAGLVGGRRGGLPTFTELYRP